MSRAILWSFRHYLRPRPEEPLLKAEAQAWRIPKDDYRVVLPWVRAALQGSIPPEPRRHLRALLCHLRLFGGMEGPPQAGGSATPSASSVSRPRSGLGTKGQRGLKIRRSDRGSLSESSTHHEEGGTSLHRWRPTVQSGIGYEAMVETPRMKDWLKELLSELRQGLEDLYGERLKGFYLYGSWARGEAKPESDLDVLIVLDEVEHYYGELERTAELVSDLSLCYDVTVSRVLISESQWADGDEPFLLTAREDAVAA